MASNQTDLHEMQVMAVEIMAGKPFEDTVKRGVRDTPANKAAFERLKTQIAEIVARGGTPDLLAE